MGRLRPGLFEQGRALGLVLAALWLSACATTRNDAPPPDGPSVAVPDIVATPILDPEPDSGPGFEPMPKSAPPPPAPKDPPDEALIIAPSAFGRLAGWKDADHTTALAAFRRSCKSMLAADPDAWLNPNLPQYGRYRDWQAPCEAALRATHARPFFESLFAPINLSVRDGDEGLLTGYYEPEVEVRIAADAVFSEPILALPDTDTVRRLPRARLSARSARVIAYGRPIDVFFLQVQGSGRLRYADGRILRAGYAGNNGRAYTSIGRILIRRGELTREQSAKRNIEAWMEAAGPEKARALMNENKRYIFFQEQSLSPEQGPIGAMQVPLTAMGSMAVDPRYHPYGTLAWLDTRLPQAARDYRGAPTRLLVSLQDTGSAIRGPLRGDLFFGSGSQAGARAGVMKHPVRWTVLLPKALAPLPPPHPKVPEV